MPVDRHQSVDPEQPQLPKAQAAPVAKETTPLPQSDAGKKANQIIKDAEAKSEVLEEFDFEGRPAQILRLRIGDISTEDLEAHARNLATMNFKLLPDVHDAAKKAAERQKKFLQREKFKNWPLLKKLYAISNEDLEKIYPDGTEAEHFHAYRDKTFPSLMKAGNLLAIQIDGKIAAVLGVRLMGISQSGREVHELLKGSVLNDLKYRDKKLWPRLTKVAIDTTMEKNPEAMWITCSRNPKVLKSYKKHGWHIAPLDDPHEAVQVMKDKCGEYLQTMQKQGYQAIYLDPKVDQVTWESENPE